MRELMHDIGKRAKKASHILAKASGEQKEKALKAMSEEIKKQEKAIIAANEADIKNAEEKGLDKAMIDRLRLDSKKINSMASGLIEIANFEDPVDKELAAWERPNGLKISRVTVPLGVIGIIYESRPNVTADAAGLCIKSGNAVILRGGSESLNSSKIIVDAMHAGLRVAGLPEDSIQLIPVRDREAVGEMLKMSEYIDIIIPRGGKGLCQRVQDESRIPTLLHLEGLCHTYIHKDAKLDMAIEVVHNAKLRRTGICGATETIVIDSSIAGEFLPKIADSLIKGGCELRGDSDALSIDNRLKPASEEDWHTEYLDAIVSVKIVDNLNEAINFISEHSSHHTDAIITENDRAVQRFLKEIDSAIVMHNASTQFADGGEFGMGAEIGIATGRLHARGPVGAAQLVTYKYIVKGSGQIRPV